MNIDAICPRKDQLIAFRQAWPDLDKLYQFHKQCTPWLNEQTIKDYMEGYKKQIAKQQQSFQLSQQTQFDIEEDKKQTFN